MSKSEISTREKILSKALEMFNERGVEYVGLRELAALLKMRVSNITYYFPIKDDLVNQLSLELNELNSKVVVENKQITIRSFLEMLNLVFLNQIKYRCLLLSFVHLMSQNKPMSTRYPKTQHNRNAALKSNLETMVHSGYLKLKDPEEIEFLVSALALIIRFWISEAAVSFRHLNPGEQVNHYLMMIVKLFMPYSTLKARKEFKQFIVQLNNVFPQ